jgi:hypothetical protein
MSLQILGIGAVVVFLTGLGVGWKYENNRFVEFREASAAAAAKQEAKVESITKQQSVVTKGIQNEYEAKVAAIRNYYSSIGVRYTGASGGQMPGLSPTSPGFDATTAYPILAAGCTETTLMLTSLQSWINMQLEIK